MEIAHADVWAAALKLANGDARRLLTRAREHDVAVYVCNSPRHRDMLRESIQKLEHHEPIGQYAIRYGDRIVRDPSWLCPADVIATFHGQTDLVKRRVDGELIRWDSDVKGWVNV